MNGKICPVLLGADLNCYNIARAFHMEYGVKSYAFGRYAVSATKYSRIVNFTAVADMDSDATMLKILTDFAHEHEGDRLYLFGCTDDYAAMIIRNRDKLGAYTCPYPPLSLFDSISKKAEFYEQCDRFGIPYPKTVIFTSPAEKSALSQDALGFPYPVIVKPSSSVDYWKHPFDGMKKVYIADTPERAEEIISEIYASGYPQKMIVQEYIPGGDDHMRVLTSFSGADGHVRTMCLGHTMVEEHTPKGLGNHAAIVTEPVSSLPGAEKIRAMLDDIGYTGFANFDLKYTGRGGEFVVFEVNLRQGRSNMYMTAAGVNVAKLAVEEYDSPFVKFSPCENEHFWHHVPKSVAYEYTEDKALVEKAKSLAAAKKETSSLWYGPDLAMNPLRFVCVCEQLRRQKKKFAVYYPKKSEK